MDIWVIGTSNKHFLRSSKTGTNFPKKLSSYWQNSTLCDKVHFVVAILFVLTLVSDRVVLNRNDVILILAVSTKKTVLQFFENGFRFPENLFQR